MKYILFFLCLFALVVAPSAHAAKKFVKKAGSSAPATTNRGSSGSAIPASVSYRGDKLAILLSFPTFTGIDTVNYALSYTSNGIQQGVGGVIRADNNPAAVRELYFGTCSHGVCTPHMNLKNARLSLVVKYTNGKAANKSYVIKTYR